MRTVREELKKYPPEIFTDIWVKGDDSGVSLYRGYSDKIPKKFLDYTAVFSWSQGTILYLTVWME